MSKTPSDKPTGRPVNDENGNRVWKWGNGESDVETATVRALAAELEFDTTAQNPHAQGSNPYDQTNPASKPVDSPKRRSLDDMRQLSEKIKKSKQWTRDE